MERKIGEIFEYNGEWYQCVESQDGSCKHCDMNFEGKCPIPIKECTESGRSDKSYVIFKKLEQVGEPYERPRLRSSQAGKGVAISWRKEVTMTMSKQVLDAQQMRHLQELGMELKETMLYWVVYEAGHENNFVTTKENAMEIIDESFGMLPAYTLQDVLDALPKDISKDGCTWSASLYIDFESNRIAYGNTDRYGFEVYHEIMIEKDLIDTAYEMLCWCIENGYAKIGKEESDERADR